MTLSAVPRGDLPPHPKIAVVIPSYKVKRQILSVIERIGPEVSDIYVVDDKCPDGSGEHVEKHCLDPRVHVIFHAANTGVGGATISGYRAAVADGAEVIVKIDGDGQMDPAQLRYFVEPILHGDADYCKGNRFFNLEDARQMPPIRLFGNAALSLMARVSSGYWSLFDPTNGYTAIQAKIVRALPLERVDCRYFFESDMLFHINMLRGVVVDIPMMAVYGEEISNLSIRRAAADFSRKHLRNFAKRVLYSYFLRDFSIASIELLAGSMLTGFGITFGAWHWYQSWSSGVAAPLGTIMLAALPVILGLQFLLAFLSFDIMNQPKVAVHRRLSPAVLRDLGRRNATDNRPAKRTVAVD